MPHHSTPPSHRSTPSWTRLFVVAAVACIICVLGVSQPAHASCVSFPRGGSAMIDCITMRTFLYSDEHCSTDTLMASIGADGVLLAVAPPPPTSGSLHNPPMTKSSTASTAAVHVWNSSAHCSSSIPFKDTMPPALSLPYHSSLPKANAIDEDVSKSIFTHNINRHGAPSPFFVPAPRSSIHKPPAHRSHYLRRPLRDTYNNMRRRNASDTTPSPPSPTYELPEGCSWASMFPRGDDDDINSMSLNWTQSVHCSGAGLTAMPHNLPTSIFYLHLGENSITSLSANSFENYTLLVHLELGSNNLTALPSGIFSSLSQLQLLTLSSNDITSLPPSIFSSLSHLQGLGLFGNLLTSLPSGIISSLSQMLLLGLNYNQLLNLPENAFSSMTQLITLALFNNQLTSLPANAFSSQSQLQNLYLHSNELTSLPPNALSSMSQLLQLRLGFNFLTSLPAGVFSSLAQLQQLSLNNNLLTSLPANVFSSLWQLQFLDISFNLLTSIPPYSFSSLSQLQYLSLTNNLLSSIGPTFFSSILPASPAQCFGESIQGNCLEQNSQSTPCPTDAEQLQMYLQGNPIKYISKTAFDLLSANMLVQLSATLPAACCGMEWLATSPRLSPGSTSQVLCGNRSITSFPPELSICTCKNLAYDENPARCYSLINYTSSLAAPGRLSICSATGCLAGQRVYTTGSSFQCNDTNYNEDMFTLYETACQECGVSNCSNCYSSLTGCDQCAPGSLLLQTTTSTLCVISCPDGYFPNTTKQICEDCNSNHCALCRDPNTCQGCIDGYGLYLGQCFFPCPHGYGLLSGNCVDCSTAPVGTPNCPLPSSTISHSQSLVPILVPLLLCLGAIVAVSVWVWRRSKKTSSSLKVKLIASQSEMEAYRKVWQISHEDIAMGAVLGKGAVGEVYEGRWRDMAVAIKTITGAWMTSEEMAKELDKEATMLQTVRHAHVVQFYGAGTLSDGTPFMVTELMELGNLTNVLQDSSVTLDWLTKKRFANEIALGMALVHSLGRMHRDLKSGNILVTRGAKGAMHLKVADFGTATLATLAAGTSAVVAVDHDNLDEGELIMLDERVTRLRSKGVGTSLWMAPEILGGRTDYGAKADVYSYGIVMWEIAAREEPWQEVKGAFLLNELLKKITSEQRPRVEQDWPAEYVVVMRRCWATKAEDRPTFAEVVQALGVKQRAVL